MWLLLMSPADFTSEQRPRFNRYYRYCLIEVVSFSWKNSTPHHRRPGSNSGFFVSGLTIRESTVESWEFLLEY